MAPGAAETISIHRRMVSHFPAFFSRRHERATVASPEEHAPPQDQLGGLFIESWRELTTAIRMTSLIDLLQLDSVRP